MKIFGFFGILALTQGTRFNITGSVTNSLGSFYIVKRIQITGRRTV